MTHPLVIIAGADQALFDALSAESAKAFAPNGTLILRPAPNGLGNDHAQTLLAAARGALRALPETTLVNTVVVTIMRENEDEDERRFRDQFFPFALYRHVTGPDYSDARSNARRNQIRNKFVVDFKREVAAARDRANLVKSEVSRMNMSPLLLPVRNFRRDELLRMLRSIYDALPTAADPMAVLTDAKKQFEAAVPYTKPKDDDRRCFSDGNHFFKTPGRHRHGYYRNAKDDEHQLTCLLNARSRLGGGFAHDFHFDCAPLRKLDAAYDDCHGQKRTPKERHVNIAPSDAVV